ncbi:delta-like protein 4 [Teleopsis dalmanni]|uniref:delta-like protein 4 n=1 Tax=Teleopsis dalmanni TaxID=139649 RepID=UPI0018CE0CEE|nr:delta-like protein 4 [Teleopsis dalmanni]
MAWLWLILVVAVLPFQLTYSFKRNYEAKYINSNIPEWKQRACEKPHKDKASTHYFCDTKGDVKCLPGWQGDLCQVPMCRRGCDPMNGYCQKPGECRCRIGYTGELCNKCIPLPGCQHGYCNKPFECICNTGWDGLFCTEPTCRQGCHSTRGYCEVPGECRCRIGWAGRNCSDCSVLPGCRFGTCSKPLECKCLPGYTGLLCSTALCADNCNKRHGYCLNPGECRCRVGWTGKNCDKCYPYPGCVNGDCDKPWECNCKTGWGGMLCDEKLTFCKDNPNICKNGGRCISTTHHDGSFQCHCKHGYLGKNCEITDEFLLTSTAEPRITPPTLPIQLDESEEVMAQSIFLLPAGVTSRPTTTTTTATVISANINEKLSKTAPTRTALINTLSITTTESKELLNKTTHALGNETQNMNIHKHILVDSASEKQHVFSQNSTITESITTVWPQSSVNSTIIQTAVNENFDVSNNNLMQNQSIDRLNSAPTIKAPTTTIQLLHTKIPPTLNNKSEILTEEYDEIGDDDGDDDEDDDDEDDDDDDDDGKSDQNDGGDSSKEEDF